MIPAFMRTERWDAADWISAGILAAAVVLIIGTALVVADYYVAEILR